MRLTRQTVPPESVELHLIDLDADETPTAEVLRCLDADELARGARLRDAGARRRFHLRRLHVRRHLGARLGCDPSVLRFTYGVAGKPFVIGTDVSFSVAHSSGHALIALAGQGAVGCDIERIDLGFDWRGTVGADVLTPDEADRLATQAPTAAASMFFEMWTLKEACLKCSGLGLSVTARTVHTEGGGLAARGGSLQATTLRLKSGFVAAVAWDSR